GALGSSALQTSSPHFVAAERAQAFTQRLRIGGLEKHRRSVPQFAQSRDIREQQRASGACSLQHGKPEGLVKGGADENRGRLHLPKQRFVRYIAEVLAAVCNRAKSPSLHTGWPGNPDQPIEARRDRRDR